MDNVSAVRPFHPHGMPFVFEIIATWVEIKYNDVESCELNSGIQNGHR